MLDIRCQAKTCEEEAAPLPGDLIFLDLSLCKGHIQHLLLLRKELQRMTSAEGYVEHELLAEARGLVYPIPGIPRLTVLEGGA